MVIIFVLLLLIYIGMYITLLYIYNVLGDIAGGIRDVFLKSRQVQSSPYFCYEHPKHENLRPYKISYTAMRNLYATQLRMSKTESKIRQNNFLSQVSKYLNLNSLIRKNMLF